MEGPSKSLVKEALSDEEFAKLPPSIIFKVDEYFDKEFGEYLTAKAVYETGRLNNEQKIENLEKELAVLKEQHSCGKSNLEAATQNLNQLENQVEQYRADFIKLNDSRTRAEHDAAEFRRQRDAAIDERDNVQAVLERRCTEVERLRSDVTSLSEQLQAAITAKCEVLAKSEEVLSMKNNLEFRERRMEQERSMLNSQIENLNADLKKRVNELLQIRRENTTQKIDLQTALDTKTEELKNANDTIKSLTESNNELTAKLESLVERLKDQREAETRYHDSFTQELKAQTKMADLYKDMAEEAKAQIVQLTDGISELQKLLSDASQQYGDLETKYKEEKLAHEEAISKKNECIELLKKELEDANELLKTTREQKLESVIESLAPSATATSRLIKSGMSLTQIYSQYVTVSEDNIIKDAEIKRLNMYIETIVKELDEKAPLLMKLREDYEVAVDHVKTLSKQNENLVVECHNRREECAEATKAAAHFTRENERLKMELGDLSRQVCYLLKEIEQVRQANAACQKNDNGTDYHSSSDIISKRLVTFSDIEELQANNQKLLVLVRELSSKQEEAEGITPAEAAELRSTIDSMRESQTDLLQAQERQNNMLTALIRQRDSYKKLYHDAMTLRSASDKESLMDVDGLEELEEKAKSQQKPATPCKPVEVESLPPKELVELKKKLEDNERIMKALKDDYENFQKEKSTNDRMITEQVESLKNENRNLTQSTCKLTSAIEYKDEQLKICKSNIDILKKQIDSLEKKNNTYNNIIVKHEQSLKHLTDEVLNSQSKLSHSEVMLDNIRQENKLLKDSESRLMRERDSLHREAHGQSLLLNNLESIKASFERSETEGKIRLESRLDETSRECSALRRRLQEEQDRFRELSSHLERQATAAKDRMEEEKVQSEKLRQELATVREELTEKTNKIDELSKKMKLNYQSDGNPLNEQLKSFERDLDEARSKIDTLQQQLKTAKLQSIQYCDVSENAEKELKELNDSYQQYKKTTESKLETQNKLETDLKRQLASLQQELANRSDGQRDTTNDLKNQLTKSTDEVTVMAEEIQNLKMEIEVSKGEITRLNENVREAEEKYSSEMMYHYNDIQALTAAKEELSKLSKQRDELVQAKREAVQALEINKESWEKREQALSKEKNEIQLRMDELDKQNQTLHSQLEALSTQLSIAHAQQVSSDTADTSVTDVSMNKSLSEDDHKSSDQLLQIIKFLRREKDILVAKFDILQAENSRLKSQYELTLKQLEEAKLAETNARTRSDADVVTTAKHSEVLRKVETLNAITDSNRILREERDTLLRKVQEFSEKISKLEDELTPLQEKNRDLAMKAEAAITDNVSLKAEATRWRQRANSLIERANKTTPEDWRRLQTERENLAKLLMAEKENVRKANEQKTRVEQQVGVLQKQLQLLNENIKKNNDELNALKQANLKLTQDLADSRQTVVRNSEESSKLFTEIGNKTKEYKALMSKYVSVRALARKYKDQVEEESKAPEPAPPQEPTPPSAELLEQYREEGRREISDRVTSLEKNHNEKLQELNQQVTSSQEELGKLRKENEALRQEVTSRYERSQSVLRSAKAKIQNLNETNENLCREVTDLRGRLDNQDDSDVRISTLKTQYETKIARLEKEKTECFNERKMERERQNRDIESLNQHLNQLQRQLSGQHGPKPSTSSGPVEKSPQTPPTANIKPMAGQTPQSVSVNPRRTGETPFASIRPMSMPVRTVAMLYPTSVNSGSSAGSSGTQVAVPPQQQIVHTTGNSSIEALSSSPTSSHTDYMPATSSASPAVPPIRQVAVPPTQQSTVTIGMGSCEEPPSAAESTQDMEAETVDQEPQQAVPQQAQQAVALVLPRVEQQSEHEPQPAEQSSSGVVVASSQPASSSNTVTTTQAGLKRTREIEGDSSTTSVHDDQESNSQPQPKRTRMQVLITESGIEVEYQVPTSSQRDQEDDVICVDSDDDDEDEEEGPDDGVEVLDEPDDDGPYEEGDNGDEGYEAEGLTYDNDRELTSYDDADCQMEQEAPEEPDNNEVEIIDDSSAAPDASNSNIASQSVAGSSGDSDSAAQTQGGAQSEAISSASSETATASVSNQPAPSIQHTYALRGRNVTPLTRQSQMMIGHGFEESGDDGIVPSTPTLYVPRRTDAFGEAVSSPHVPSGGRFTFNDPPPSTGRSSSNTTEQGQVEVIDDSRLDQLEDTGTGRSVPTTPLQVSPQGDTPQTDNNVLTSGSNEDINASEATTAEQTNQSREDATASASIPEITITGVSTLSEASGGSGDATSITGQDDEQPREAEAEVQEMAPPADVAGPSGDVQIIEVDDAEAEEGSDGVSSEGEKPIPVEDSEMEEGREAEASQSPSSNSPTRGHGTRMGLRSSYRGGRSRTAAHRPIIWNEQQNRAGPSTPRPGPIQPPTFPQRAQRARRGARRLQQNNYMRY